MPQKMPRRLVALSSSAIATIYLAGLVYTRGADAGLGSGASAAATSVPTSAPPSSTATTSTSSPTALVSASATTLPAAQPTAAPAAAATSTSVATATSAATASAYRDGTFSGTGTSRRGNVSVAVTIQSGRIANVTIANITTQYPVSRIASLPAQVITRQSGQIDNISGATYSAQAFRTAVQAALSAATA